MSEFDIKNYRPLGDGSLQFGNWQAIRSAIEAAYRALGRKFDGTGIPVEDWNLAGLAIEAYKYQQRSTCIECGEKLWQVETIRCLDCKAPLCERCAPKHFWPSGRRPLTPQERNG